MKKYFNFIKENNNDIIFNKDLILEKISNLKKWLYIESNYTLGMNNIINNLLEPYKTDLNKEELKKYEKDLNLLRMIGKIDVDKKINNTLKKQNKLIKIDNKWHPVNKLNTNYLDLSVLLTDIIEKLFYDNDPKIKNFIKPIYDIMIDDIKKGLLLLKPRLQNIIKYYFIDNGNGLEDFLKYTKYIEINSKIGEDFENKVITYFKNKKFEIKYYGGNGDYIDMIFGIDIIVYREDYGYKTIQIKSYLPNNKDFEYYDVDWIVTKNNNDIIVINVIK